MCVRAKPQRVGSQGCAAHGVARKAPSYALLVLRPYTSKISDSAVVILADRIQGCGPSFRKPRQPHKLQQPAMAWFQVKQKLIEAGDFTTPLPPAGAGGARSQTPRDQSDG